MLLALRSLWEHKPIANTLGVGTGIFLQSLAPAAVNISITTRTFAAINKPVSRQMVDPNTGMITPAWEFYLKQINDAVNTINQNTSQS